MDRIILVDKPAGISSFGIVARIRRQLRDENGGVKVKVGHTGTLDPFATGLLILLSGKMTKKSNDFLKLDKEYFATIKLGENSTTCDPEGEMTKISDKIPTKTEIENTLQKFVGEITQTPPAFSAIKINGQRAYKLARAGKEVEIPRRQVKIYELELVDYKYPELKIRAKVSSGTYIRTLGEDIGKSLETGAYLTELRRTVVGDYLVNDAIKL